MAYVTGTAVNIADLRTAIVSACTSNGWTLTGAVLSKGANFVTLTVTGNFIYLLAGTGQSAGALTGAADSPAIIGSPTTGAAAFAWPLTYEINLFTSPDEVFVVVNYSTDYYQWLAWGTSSIVTPGTGAWFSGSLSSTGASGGISLSAPPSHFGNFGYRRPGVEFCPALFHASGLFSAPGEYINHGILGGTGWSAAGDTRGALYRAPLDACLPSAWNSETVLLPIQAFTTAYGSSKVALVLDVANARAVRIDNHLPGDVITLGADRWKIYPWYLKAAASSTTSSGPYGWAIRYTGP